MKNLRITGVWPRFELSSSQMPVYSVTAVIFMKLCFVAKKERFSKLQERNLDMEVTCSAETSVTFSTDHTMLCLQQKIELFLIKYINNNRQLTTHPVRRGSSEGWRQSG
jgi:hypothetical protein